MSNSLKKSLSKINKTAVIKNLVKGYQKPPGRDGIRGLYKKKGYDSDDSLPELEHGKKFSPQV